MARKGKITDLFDIASIEKQLKVAIEAIDTWVDAVDKGSKSKVALKGATKPSEVSAGSEKVIAQQREQLKLALKIAEEQKAVISLLKQRYAAEAKLVTSQTDYNRETTKMKIETQKINKELQLQAKYELSAPNSLERVVALRAKIRQEVIKTNLNDTDRIKILNAQIDKLTAIEKKYVDQAKQQSLNVGNYQGSAKIIVEALERARSKVAEVGRQFGEASPEANNARKEFEALNRITSNPQFLNISAKLGDTNAELRFFTKQLNQLEDAGQKNSAVYKEVQQRLAQLTDQLGDTKQEIKALASDSRQFDLFAGSVTFAADAFQTLAGATVLFGASEEDAAEATRTLIAVQSVANGVKGIANELTTKGTAANKLFAFVQLQVKTAMDITATSAARLKAAMTTLGIGALVVGVGLLIANFGKLKSFLFGTNRESERLAESQKRLAEFNKEVTASVAKESAELKILKAKIEDTKLPMDVRIANVKDLQALYPQYFKDLKQEDILNGNAAAAYDLAAAAILRKAKALAASKKVEELSAGTLDIEAESAADRKRTDEAIKNATARYKIVRRDETELDKSREEVQADLEADFQKREKRRKADRDALTKDQEFYLGTIVTNTQLTDEQRKQKEEEDKKAADKKKKEDKDNAKDYQKTAEDKLKAELELEKRVAAAKAALVKENAEQRIRDNENILNDPKQDIDARLKAATEIEKARKLIAAQEYIEATASEAEIQYGKRKIIKKSHDEILLALTQFNNKLDEIDREHGKTELEIAEEIAEAKKKVFEDAQEHSLAQHDIELARIQNQYDSELVALDDKYASDLIKEKEYNDAKLDLQQKLNEDIIRENIKFAKAQLEIAKLIRDAETDPAEKLKQTDAIAKAEADLAALEIKLAGAVVEAKQRARDKSKKLTEEEKAEIIKLFDDIRQYSEVVLTTISGFIDAIATRNKNKLQEESDEIDKKKEKEIAAAEQTITDKEKLAATVTVIEARAAAQKETIERRQREIDERKARFEKAAAIFRLSLNLAEAIATLNVLKIIAATAQLAVAIATPVPKYKFGTGDKEHPGGPAIVGDGGKAEGIELPGGHIIKSPSKSTLMYLPKGTKVHPDYNKMMVKGTLVHMPAESAGVEIDNTDIVNGLKEVTAAIGKIPQQQVTVDNILRRRIRTGSSINDHITRNLGK